MTDRENFLSIAKRTGYERMPVSFNMCPDLARRYEEYVKVHPIEVPWDVDYIPDLPAKCADSRLFLEKYYAHKDFKAGTNIDGWGVTHEPGSAAAYHMTYMHHPMEGFDSVEQILSYPFPEFDISSMSCTVISCPSTAPWVPRVSCPSVPRRRCGGRCLRIWILPGRRAACSYAPPICWSRRCRWRM